MWIVRPTPQKKEIVREDFPWSRHKSFINSLRDVNRLVFFMVCTRDSLCPFSFLPGKRHRCRQPHIRMSPGSETVGQWIWKTQSQWVNETGSSWDSHRRKKKWVWNHLTCNLKSQMHIRLFLKPNKWIYCITLTCGSVYHAWNVRLCYLLRWKIMQQNIKSGW